MTNETAGPSVGGKAVKRGKIGFWAPAIIILFIALTLVLACYARVQYKKRMLEDAMCEAMAHSDWDAIRKLVSSSPALANMSIGGSEKSTLLHFVVEWGGDVAVAESIIDAGADLDAKDFVGVTPLYRAVSKRKKEMIELLLSKGADVNARENNGLTPLHIVDDDDVWLAEALVAKGANINARDNYGNTPLRWALRGKNDAIAELLRKAGAKE